MKYLNIGAVILLMALASQLLVDRTPPPEDFWFQNAVVKSPRPVLVKFGADWCAPCRQMESVLDQAQGRLSGRVKIVRVDVDSKPEIARHYGISGIPRLMLFREGKIVATHGGFADAKDLQAWVESKVR